MENRSNKNLSFLYQRYWLKQGFILLLWFFYCGFLYRIFNRFSNSFIFCLIPAGIYFTVIRLLYVKIGILFTKQAKIIIDNEKQSICIYKGRRKVYEGGFSSIKNIDVYPFDIYGDHLCKLTITFHKAKVVFYCSHHDSSITDNELASAEEIAELIKKHMD